MTTTSPRRVTLDDALTDTNRLAFERHYPQRSAGVTLAYHGVPVTVTLNDASAETVEKLVDSLLSRDGWGVPTPAAATTAPAAPQRPQRTPLPDVVYRPDGTACCPWHHTPLREGQHGHYCPSKESDPERSTPKGYCRFTVKDL